MTEKLAVIIIVILIVMLVVAVLMIRRYGMKSRVALFGVGLPLLMFFVIMAMSAFRTPMWMDEYVFYRLSSDLPHYSTTSDWFYVDRPDVLNPSVTWEDKSSVVIDKRASFDWIYNNPVYLHDPLAPALVYPLVKTLNVMADKGIIQHIEAQPGYASVSKTLTSDEKNELLKKMDAETITKVLRVFTICLFLLAMFLSYKIMSKKAGKKVLFFAVPIAVGMQLLTGVYLFYWDIFMMFFFVLTLYLMETNHPKWAFLTACCMVNTKMFIGILFLIPLIIKNRKMFWAAFSIIPFYLAIVLGTHDLFYPFRHYFTGLGMGTHNYVYTLYDNWGWFWLIVDLGVPVFLLMTVPLFWRLKKYPEYIALWICAMVYAWCSGLGITHLSCMLYVGVLIFPLVVYEFNLYERLAKFLQSVNPPVEKV